LYRCDIHSSLKQPLVTNEFDVNEM
jgi:hypothetical protein